MRNVLVTGGTGFIGRNLVQRLIAEDCHVRVLSRHGVCHDEWPAGVELVQGDIQDATAVKSASVGIDTIFHLAARTPEPSDLRDDDAIYRAINVEGTRNVVEGALAGGARSIIFFSSVQAMGEGTTACLDETAPTRPATAYGRSKLEAEMMVRAATDSTQVRGVSLRLPLVYGPGNKGNMYRMIAAIDHGVFPPVREVSNCRSLVHVSNVVDAAMLAAKAMHTSPCYIVTDARPYSTRKLYELICVGLGKRVPRWHVPLGILQLLGWMGDVLTRIAHRRLPVDSHAINKLTQSAWYSCDKITRELGYRPSITVEAALPELIGWYRSR
jgi:nucleoside-diphosphate-sugar epimerase